MKSSLFCLYEFCSLVPRDSGSEGAWVQEFVSVLRIIKGFICRKCMSILLGPRLKQSASNSEVSVRRGSKVLKFNKMI